MDTQKICSRCKKPLDSSAPDGLCPECLLQAGLGTGADIDSDSHAESGRAAFAAPSVEEVAGFFPQCEILDFIGQGGMGAVYKVRQKELDRVAALKMLPPDIGRDAAFVERFTREARALARLNHPGIVTLYEFGRAEGHFYFLMEFVDGASLRQLLNAGRLSPHEALAIVPQICDALQYAHDLGIVHRDIKPENILIDRRGHVKVADFGLVKLTEQANETAHSQNSHLRTAFSTETGKVMGTPQYMAPEQKEHPAEVDHRADIYALGVVFYQMLTGELPGRRIEPPSMKVSIDVRLDEVVLRALEKQPERRYQQVSALKTQVESITTQVHGSDTVSHPHNADATAADRMQASLEPDARFSPVAIAGAALIPVFIAALVFWASSPGPGPASAFARSIVVASSVTTTVLGWIAANQIRLSRDKMRGLWLAVFDGLLFPLLFLDVAIYEALLSRMPCSVTSGQYDDAIMKGSSVRIEWVMLAAALVYVYPNYYIVRRVWRAFAPEGGSVRKGPSAASWRAKEGPGGKPRSGLLGALLALAPYKRWFGGLAVIGFLGLFVAQVLYARDRSWNGYGFTLSDQESHTPCNYFINSCGVGETPKAAAITRIVNVTGDALMRLRDSLDSRNFIVQHKDSLRVVDRWQTNFLLLAGRTVGEEVRIPLDMDAAKQWFGDKGYKLKSVNGCNKFWNEVVAPRLSDYDRIRRASPQVEKVKKR